MSHFVVNLLFELCYRMASYPEMLSEKVNSYHNVNSTFKNRMS